MRSKQKIIMLMVIAAVSFATLLDGCKKDSYVPLPVVCPIVLSTDPANGATSVALNKVITITLNEIMNPSTLTQASITLTGGGSVTGTITYSGTTASFAPSAPLTLNATYTGRVTTAVKDAAGNALQTDYVWSFSTGATVSPVVISTDPGNNETGVSLNKIVKATFNMPMDPLTINGTTFTVKQGTTAIAGTVSYGDATGSFTPAAPLAMNTIYTATITTGTKNTGGTAMANNYV